MAKRIHIAKRVNGNVQYTLEDLYREYQPQILKALIATEKNVMDAEDITQNTFIYLMDYWDRLDWNRFEAALGQILYSTRLLYYRAEKNNKEMGSLDTMLDFGMGDGLLDPMRQFLAQERLEVIKAGIKTFTPMEREVFCKYYFEGLATKDISSKSIGRTLSLLQRARTKLFDFYNAHFKE